MIIAQPCDRPGSRPHSSIRICTTRKSGALVTSYGLIRIQSYSGISKGVIIMTLALAIYAAILSTLWPGILLYRHLRKRKISVSLSLDRDWSRKEADAHISIENKSDKVLEFSRAGVLSKSKESNRLIRVRNLRYIDSGNLRSPYIGESDTPIHLPASVKPERVLILILPFSEFLRMLSWGHSTIKCFFEDDNGNRYFSNSIQGDTSIWQTIAIQDPPPGLINSATGRTYHEEYSERGALL